MNHPLRSVFLLIAFAIITPFTLAGCTRSVNPRREVSELPRAPLGILADNLRDSKPETRNDIVAKLPLLPIGGFNSWLETLDSTAPKGVFDTKSNAEERIYEAVMFTGRDHIATDGENFIILGEFVEKDNGVLISTIGTWREGFAIVHQTLRRAPLNLPLREAKTSLEIAILSE